MAPSNYDPDRRFETYTEAHNLTDKQRKRKSGTTKKRLRNREIAQFGKVNWDAYQHDQMYDMIMRANVGDMGSRSGQWTTLANKIEATTGEVQQVMQRVMGAWRGETAVAAAESSNRLMQWAGEASNTADKIAGGMSEYTSAVGEAQARMPEPGFSSAERNFRDGYSVEGTGGPSTAVLVKQLLSDGMVSHEEAKQRKSEAVAVMESYEGQSKTVHDTMPHFADPGPTHDGVSSGDAAQVSPPPSDEWAPSRGTLDSSTTAAGFVEPGLGGGSTGGPSGGSYGGGAGSLGSGGSDALRNSPGFGGMAGRPGAAGAGMAGRGAGAAGAAGRGGAGAFGGAPGHGGRGEEDKEHKNKYDDGLDLFDDLPPAYPPVFGA